MTDLFIIPLNGLPAGKSAYHWQAGKEFFDSFENSDILDASVGVDVTVEKSGSYLGVDCNISGSLVVECDRCLEEVSLPVSSIVLLSLKFGDEPAEDSDLLEDGREIVYLPSDAADIELGQIIYDYSLLSLPLQRVHPEGGCNPEVMRRLNPSTPEKRTEETIKDSPFAVLKGMFDEEK